MLLPICQYEYTIMWRSGVYHNMYRALKRKTDVFGMKIAVISGSPKGKYSITLIFQKKWADPMKMYLVGAFLSNEKILAKMGSKMNEGMPAPYEKLFAQPKARRKGKSLW